MRCLKELCKILVRLLNKRKNSYKLLLPWTRKTMSPAMIATKIRLGNPISAINPNTASAHNTIKTKSISLRGLGRLVAIIRSTKKISRFQRVIGCALMVKRITLGIKNPGKAIYPKSQRITSAISRASNM